MKIIIENRTNMSMLSVLSYVASVIGKGKISETSKGLQFCFVTVWKNGVTVYADKNKKSDRFVVTIN